MECVACIYAFFDAARYGFMHGVMPTVVFLMMGVAEARYRLYVSEKINAQSHESVI